MKEKRTFFSIQRLHFFLNKYLKRYHARHDLLITSVLKQHKGSLTTMMQSFFCQENNTETNEDYPAALAEMQVLLSSMKSSEKNHTKSGRPRQKKEYRSESEKFSTKKIYPLIQLSNQHEIPLTRGRCALAQKHL